MPASATAVTIVTVPQASAAVWDDDAGLVFFGRGYAEPTTYGDFNGRSSVPVAVVRDGVLDGAVVTDIGASTNAVWAVVEPAP